MLCHAVLAYDYDPGVMGQLTYAVSDPHFTVVQTSPGTQTVQVAQSVHSDNIALIVGLLIYSKFMFLASIIHNVH